MSVTVARAMSDVTTKIDELEARRAARKEAIETARAEQYAKDLEAIEPIEIEHGDDRVAALKTASYVAGLPTIVLVKTPTPALFARYRQMVRKAGKNIEQVGAALDLLAESCVAYPAADVYARMKDAWPSINDTVGAKAVELGEAEGKA